MIKWLLLGVSLGIVNYTGDIKYLAFKKGLKTSQYFQKYPGWNRFIEPFIVRQIDLLIGVSNGFLQGLISDNQNKELDRKKLLESIKKSLDRDFSEKQ